MIQLKDKVYIMDGLVFYGALIIVVLLVYTFYKNNNQKLALLTILIGVYIVYSNTTGHTATDYKNEMVESLNQSAEDFAKIHKTEGFDETKSQEAMK